MSQKPYHHLNIGELVATAEDSQLGTLLGSCVAVCLFSKKGGIGGMNHYALPTAPHSNLSIEEGLRYGDVSIPMLIEYVSDLSGEKPSHLLAKIVGGASGLADKKNKIGKENVAMAEHLLRQYGIPIIARDVGGNVGRKILFHTENGRLQVALMNEVKKENPKSVVVAAPSFAKKAVEAKPASKRRVLIIDDSKTIRDLLTKIINQSSDLEVVGTAPDPIVAEKMIYDLKPDVLTLDIHMPKMDGITFLERFLPKKHIPVVMITSLSMEDGGKVLRALELGAIDYIQKPSFNELLTMTPIIHDKIKAASYSKVRIAKTKIPSISRKSVALDKNLILAIGASTGGTEAIKEVLTHLPAEIPPTVIVQHIPPIFSKAFADRLNSLCPFEVKEAEHGDILRPGLVLIAPGAKQMTIKKIAGQYKVVITDDPPMNRHKPSVDYLFNDVASLIGNNAIGLILTGMGADGAKGLLKMREAGARTLSQDEESSVVYGMPKVAYEIGASETVSALDKIPDLLLQLFEKKKVA